MINRQSKNDPSTTCAKLQQWSSSNIYLFSLSLAFDDKKKERACNLHVVSRGLFSNIDDYGPNEQTEAHTQMFLLMPLNGLSQIKWFGCLNTTTGYTKTRRSDRSVKMVSGHLF